jgi:hypothetical protein
VAGRAGIRCGKTSDVSSRGAVLETLRRCAQALAGELSGAERVRICALHEQALRALDNTHRPDTIARGIRIRQLERQMIHMQPGERAAAIRERMGIGRSNYYKLRKTLG